MTFFYWNQLFFAVKNQQYKQTCQFEHVKSLLFTKMTKGTTTLWLRALLQHHFLCVWIWIHFWQNLPGNNENGSEADGVSWKRLEKEAKKQSANQCIDLFAGKKQFLCVLQTSARLWRRHWKACRISMELSIHPPGDGQNSAGDQWGSSTRIYQFDQFCLYSHLFCWLKYLKTCYHLVISNIAMENHHF